MTDLCLSAAPAAPRRLPLSLWWLMAGAFAIGTEGFMVAGLLPLLSADLQVGAATAGRLVGVFALSYAIGSPLLAMLTARVERRRLLVGALALFALAALMAALAHRFTELALARVALGLAAGLFLPTASVVATALAPAELRGRAMAIVTGGGTVALALGVPMGAWIAGWGGWRSAYLVVAALAALGALALAFGLPHRLGASTAAPRPWAALGRPGLLPALGATALWATGGFSFYTYIALFLADAAGVDARGTGLVLATIGIAAGAGTAAGGWAADRLGADRAARGFALALVAILAGLSLAARLLPSAVVAPALVGLVALWGFTGWGFGPAQAMRLIRLAPDAAPMSLSLNASAIYLGIAAGAALGGWAVETLGATAVGAVGAACQLAGLALMMRRVG